MNHPQKKLFPLPKEIHPCHMVVDGNSHRSDLSTGLLPTTHNTSHLISEALLPQIRTVASLIAAMNHDFKQASPAIFTEEADWFAARILILNVQYFHLDITLMPMLKLANQRAKAFAIRHNIDFTPAQMKMSLHSHRPHNLLIMETEYKIENQGSLIANTLFLNSQLPSFIL